MLDKTGVLKTLPKFKLLSGHPIYKLGEIKHIVPYHHPPKDFRDRLAFYMIKSTRFSYDLITRFNPETMNERSWLTRIIFLETIAGVPGMIGGMTRHLKSLRTLENDHGWIHHLLCEAENERMHLFIFLHMRNPGILFRTMIVLGQGVFFNLYFLMYLFAPKFSHRFVGYLEEEAVHTYTKVLEKIEDGTLELWQEQAAPKDAQEYY